MKSYFTLILSALSLYSCNHTDNKIRNTTEKSIEDSGAGDKQKIEYSLDNNFLNLTTVKLPYTDSTNFDNFNLESISSQEILTKIDFKKNDEDIKMAAIRYLIPLSNNYYSIVITYLLGENELYTTLINIDHSLKIIDQIDIAYDEIAESAFRIESVVLDEQIKITNSNYMDETNPIHETKLITVSDNGKFIQ